jgi:hypothetical protein
VEERAGEGVMPEHLRAFLIVLGVADQPHSGRTFIEHCEGVYQALRAEGEDVAAAGALHSVYGTESYQPRAVPSREQVRALVGSQTEMLVWLFCHLKRSQIRALAAIERANREEQQR